MNSNHIHLIPPNADGTHALSKRKHVWHWRWTEVVDGKRQVREESLGTKSFDQAVGLRDSRYRLHQAQGARMKVSPGRKGIREVIKANPRSMIGIYAREPYEVRVRGQLVLETDDIEKALAARNAYVEENL